MPSPSKLEWIDNGNGAGRLPVNYFVEKTSWWNFTEPEQRIIAKTAAKFARLLRDTEFLPRKG